MPFGALYLNFNLKFYFERHLCILKYFLILIIYYYKAKKTWYFGESFISLSLTVFEISIFKYLFISRLTFLINHGKISLFRGQWFWYGKNEIFIKLFLNVIKFKNYALLCLIWEVLISKVESLFNIDWLKNID